jgi:hypothetical protein
MLKLLIDFVYKFPASDDAAVDKISGSVTEPVEFIELEIARLLFVDIRYISFFIEEFAIILQTLRGVFHACPVRFTCDSGAYFTGAEFLQAKIEGYDRRSALPLPLSHTILGIFYPPQKVHQ